MKVSIITPAFNEAEILPELYRRLDNVMCGLNYEWEWIIIDDHSLDNSSVVIQELVRQHSSVRSIRFARNHGSHLAALCGFQNATGDLAILVVADLQDPPEQIPDMIKTWKTGYEIVWMTRDLGRSDPGLTSVFARSYYVLMRRILGLTAIPRSGGDMVLLDRRAYELLKHFQEPSINILALIGWLGFNQAQLPGRRERRLRGHSSFTLGKKLKLFIDTVTYFSFRPLRWISYSGIILSFMGFGYAAFVLFAYLIWSNPVEGWTSLMLIFLIMQGFQLIVLGVIAEYLWRALEQGRKRPLFLIENELKSCIRASDESKGVNEGICDADSSRRTPRT